MLLVTLSRPPPANPQWKKRQDCYRNNCSFLVFKYSFFLFFLSSAYSQSGTCPEAGCQEWERTKLKRKHSSNEITSSHLAISQKPLPSSGRSRLVSSPPLWAAAIRTTFSSSASYKIKRDTFSACLTLAHVHENWPVLLFLLEGTNSCASSYLQAMHAYGILRSGHLFCTEKT